MIPSITYRFHTLPSTQNYASALLKKKNVIHGTAIVADHQSQGKGQFGAMWHDEPHQSVLMSMIFHPIQWPVNHLWSLNMLLTLCIRDAIQHYTGLKPLIKWPNDLIINGQKVSGLLSETGIHGSIVESWIPGIGINLNQSNFPDTLPMAGSIKQFTNQHQNPWLWAQWIANRLRNIMDAPPPRLENLQKEYHSSMLSWQKIVTFEWNGRVTQGQLLGTDHSGRLKLLLGDHTLLHVQPKEIQWFWHASTHTIGKPDADL